MTKSPAARTLLADRSRPLGLRPKKMIGSIPSEHNQAVEPIDQIRRVAAVLVDDPRFSRFLAGPDFGQR